ncbi:MAG: hypothetical protein J6Q84_07380 [Kiritimatiellae bacterium]|nr:hypothetical protein [Kiritimatiellia bacterium]
MESILTTIKQMLGIHEDDHFDQEIIVHINSALGDLTDIGVGPPEGFIIYDDTSIWSDFTSGDLRLERVKTFVYAKVKLSFDPPQSSTMADALKRSADEAQWRLSVIADK